MQLHLLEMSAIGPFSGTERIDFAALGRTGLFLLEGPTGSGKTTIIDAITFALYNKVAQSSADLERIHSHHADPRTVPVVTLVFETQSGIYRVQRTPRFEVPKLRGTGMTTRQPSVKLWRLSSPTDAVGELISTNLGDAEDQISRAIGLTRDQFVQTVILPQGEFATFLRARSEDKAMLLEKVFGTAFFRRVQDEIVEAGRAAEARRARAVEQIHEAVSAFAVASGLDDAATEPLLAALEDGDEDTLEALLQSTVEELKAQVDQAKRRARRATEQNSNVEKDTHDARLRQQRRDSLRELQDQDEALASRRAQVEAMRAERELAVRAQPVAGAFRTLSHAEGEQRAAAARLRSAGARLEPDLLQLDAAGLRSAAADLRRRVGVIESSLPTEEGLVRRVAERAGLARDEGERRAELASLTEQFEQLPGMVEETSRTQARADALAALRPAREVALADARAVLAAATELGRVEQRVTVLTDTAAQALGRLRDAEQGLAQLRQRRVEGMAAELGLSLSPGLPCPVCGSTQHPAPAAPGQDAVTREHVEQTERAVAALREESEDTTGQLARERERQAGLAAAAGGLDVEQAQQRVAAATSEVGEATRAESDRQQAKARLGELQARLEALQQRRTEVLSRLAALHQAVDGLDSAIAADEQEVSTARGGHPSVREHASVVAARADDLDAYTEALTARAAADRAATEAARTMAADLDAAGFDTVEEWFAARREADAIRALGDEITAYDNAVIKVRAGLAQPELADLSIDALFADVDALVELGRAAKREMVAANEELGSLRERLEGATRRRAGITAARDRTRQVLAQTADAVRVGKLVAGQGENQLRMDLVKYVLIRRFTEVLSVANLELARFSGGRYSLQHTDAKEGNARSGLGIRVNDMHTNQIREVGTLSGGETFYVSLALALALAEVVRAESGGVDLGTLFVDEGFGTLDPDVLDDVMQTLESLREGGRTVGIVSHVSELKARVADRIEVIVHPDRTSTLKVTA